MIHLVIALIHEARPLIDHYRLRRLSGSHPYVIYGNEAFTLIISGIGKVCSAAATAYLQALSVNAGPIAWLNFGITGHSDFAVGQGFLAHRIIDQATGYAYYPPLIFPFTCASSDLITVDAAENHYTDQGGYDMEASAFYKVALASSSIEWIHCYKVVSDNPEHPIETLTKASISELIFGKMDEISTMLSVLTSEITAHRQLDLSDEHLGAILKKWHFTETQRSELKKLMRRGQTLYGEKFFSPFNLTDYRGAKPFLSAVKQQLDSKSSL